MDGKAELIESLVARMKAADDARCCTAPPRTRSKPPAPPIISARTPVASFAATAAELTAAFGEPDAMARTARHRAGERTGAQLLEMRVLDIAVHTWDLARAIHAGESLDPDVAAFALTLQDTLDAGRQRGAFAPPPGKAPAGGSAQDRLLYLSGRRPG